MKRVQFLAHRTLCSLGSFLRLDQFDLEFPALTGALQKQTLINVHRGDAVAILLHLVSESKDNPDQCLVLCEQFRLPTLLNADTGFPNEHILEEREECAGYQVELLAGTCAPEESWLESARREIFEEVGQKPAYFEYITSYYPSPAACSERLHLYYARVKWPECKPWPSTESREELSSRAYCENIRLLFVSPLKFLEMIETGKLADGKCYVAAEWMRRAENTQRFFEEN